VFSFVFFETLDDGQNPKDCGCKCDVPSAGCYGIESVTDIRLSSSVQSKKLSKD
jgi:hypothetical protein